MLEEKARLVRKTSWHNHYFLFQLLAPKIAKQSRAGNFVMVRVRNEPDPILRRPLGILKTEGDHLWLYFVISGRGTAILAELNEGTELSLLGPCGNNFPEFNKQTILLIAGGRGIVPLLFFLQEQGKKNSCHLLWGGKNRSDFELLPFLNFFELQSICLTSEDGSIGEQGILTNFLIPIVKKCSPQVSLSCGPEAMFKQLAGAEILRASKNYISAESYMGCGFGICQSCAIKTSSGFKLVCKDGPIFLLNELQWT